MRSRLLAGQGARASVLSVSGTEEHEPEHAQDQDREVGGGYEQSEHRGGPGSACRAWVGVSTV
jgi:hypothetical protein